MRFELDKEKSVKIRNNPKRRIGFEEAEEIWTNPFQRRLNFMKNTLNSPNAEELARMADRGENISKYFSNDGKIKYPVKQDSSRSYSRFRMCFQ
jgi:hypothetical protein